MEDAYWYLTISGGPARGRAVADDLREQGAVVVGMWTGAAGIGWWDDETVVLAGWPQGWIGRRSGSMVSEQGVHVERLHATVRPMHIAPLAPGGLFAHRWFEFSSADWDEFLDLSQGAWPAFEAAYESTIEGFFRSDDVDEPDGRVLLITRYPSLAVWEESRGAMRSSSGDVAESGRRFLRRRELTKRTIVRTGTLLP